SKNNSQGIMASFAYDLAGNLTDRWVDPTTPDDPTSQPSLTSHFFYDTNDQVRRVDRIDATQVGPPSVNSNNWPTTGTSYERYYYDHGRRRFLALAHNAQGDSWRFYLGGDYEV